MLKNNKTLQTCLSSTAGILIVAAILLTIGIIFRNTNIRLDCTEDKLYTLSNATKNTLKNLDRKLTIRFYYSKDVPQMPVGFKNYAKRIDDMLREYEIYSNGNIRIERLNPKPDTDAEDSANLDGISGQGSGALGLDENIYLGMAIRSGDMLVSLPFLSPEREAQLEYDVTRAILSVTHPKKPKVGIISAIKVFGGIDNPAMTFTVQEVSGTIRYNQKEIAHFITGPVSLEARSQQEYELPCTVTLAEGASLLDILILASKRSLEGLKADVDLQTALKKNGALRAPFKFRDLDISSFTE